MNRYIAFLRGINVSGHHKVPMAELRKEMGKLNCEHVITILNSGNVIFDSINDDLEGLETIISEHLETIFGFPIPIIIRTSERICRLIDSDPFKNVTITKDTRLYISLLRKDVEADLTLPWTSDNGAYNILEKRDKDILSVLDLSITKTPKAMGALEKYYGKDITTRNWNTIKRIVKKLDVDGQ